MWGSTLQYGQNQQAGCGQQELMHSTTAIGTAADWLYRRRHQPRYN